MGDQLGSLVDELLQRTRDTSAQATSRAITRKLIRHAEGILGVHGAWVETFTFTSTVFTGIYPLISSISGGNRIGRILDVRTKGRSLNKSSLSDLRTGGPDWLNVFGDEFESWFQWGWDMLLLTPRLQHTLSVEVVATAAPVALDNTYTGNDTDTLSVSEKWSPQVVDLAEVLMLLRWRRLDALKAPLERLQGVLKL